MTGALSQAWAFLGDHTVQNVVLGSAILGVISGVLGSFAVLRRQSLLGDALAHAALPGVCLGFMVAGGRELPALLAGAFLTAVLGALAVLALTRHSRLKTDAALGVSLSVSFAIGVVLLTRIQSTGDAGQGGLDSFLFGQAAATLRSDVWLMAGVTLAALALVGALWKEFKLVAFDPTFAATLGLPVALLEGVLTVAIALAVVVGLQTVGVVLMAAMVVAPAAAARQWARSLGGMVALAAAIGVAAGVAGSLISASAANLATGPLVVLAATFAVAASLLVAPGRGILWERLKRRRERRSLKADRVLLTLHGLAERHQDRRHPAELGTLDAFHRVGAKGTRSALGRLESRGLVRSVDHGPDEGPHWALTAQGLQRARALAGDGPGTARGDGPLEPEAAPGPAEGAAR